MPLRWIILLSLIATAVSAWAFELSGTVMDKAGTPLAGADVWISQDRAVRRGRTDEAGKFAFDDVKARPVEVVARKEGHAIGGFYAIGVVDSGSIAIHLDEPDALRIRVVDQTGTAVPGARMNGVVVNDTFHIPLDDLGEAGFPSVRSDEDGTLCIPDLPKGGYAAFDVSHSNYAVTHVPYLPIGVEKVQPITIYPGIALRGRVTNEANEPVPAARVSLFRIVDTDQHGFGEALTDPEGFYKLVARPGEYFVTAFHPDYPTPRPQRAPLLDEAAAGNVDIVFCNPRVIRGRVLFAKDNPAVGIRVAYLANAVIYAETLSKIDGAFELRVGTGQGYVRVFPPPGFITEHLGDVSVTIDTQTELNIKEPIRFKPLPAIEGTVVAGRGEPQAGCLITSLDLEAPYRAVTDSEGHFRIQLGKMPNTDEVSFRAEHPLRFLRNDFKINLGKIAPLKVQLKAFDPDLRPCDKMRAGNDLTRKVGKPAPEVHCREWIDTEPLSLEKLGGKVIVMTFWAEFDKTKSRNRLIEMTMIEKALREAEDVVFLGIHEAGAERAEVATCVHELGVDFAVGIDSGPSATFEAYNTNVIPQTVLIDKKGVLRYFDVEGRLLELIKSLRIEQ